MPKTKLQKFLSYLSDLKTSRLLLSMQNNGYLLETGWLESHKIKESVNAKKEPIPWTTYSFIKFIEGYLKKKHLVFEYGSGNSSLFYAPLVKELISVEHNIEWHKKIIQKAPKNVTILLRDINKDYENSILESSLNYDVIIIDGRKRVNCIEVAMTCLRHNGIIVLDDSEREKYKPGIDSLKRKGFKRIDFWGISPGYFSDKCTSIFFKELAL